MADPGKVFGWHDIQDGEGRISDTLVKSVNHGGLPELYRQAIQDAD